MGLPKYIADYMLRQTLRRIERKYRRLGHTPKQARHLAYRQMVDTMIELVSNTPDDDLDSGAAPVPAR